MLYHGQNSCTDWWKYSNNDDLIHSVQCWLLLASQNTNIVTIQIIIKHVHWLLCIGHRQASFTYSLVTDSLVYFHRNKQLLLISKYIKLLEKYFLAVTYKWLIFIYVISHLTLSVHFEILSSTSLYLHYSSFINDIAHCHSINITYWYKLYYLQPTTNKYKSIKLKHLIMFW